jgi:hypothetical protein
VRRREALLDLNATTVAVHIAESTDVHQDIEAELLAGAEAAEHFVVTTPVAQPSFDDFATPGFGQVLDRPANLPIRKRAVFVKQSACNFHFKRLVVKQIDSRSWLRLARQKFRRHLTQFKPGLDFV